jgi:predicted ATPase/class 3 adenylate cyclase
MSGLAGYRITKLLHDERNLLTYRGYHEDDPHPLIVKISKNGTETKAQLTHEFELLTSLQGEGALKPIALEKFQDQLALVTEEFGSCSLRELIRRKRISLSDFVIYALKIISALEKIHDHNIIHGNLNSGNIQCEVDTKDVKITDFAYATDLPKLMPVTHNFYSSEPGDLPYVSPESTGLLNRNIDYRTDYYSLGVIFFEMLTGKLPKEGVNKDKLLQKQVIDSSLPSMLADIVLKLLEALPENRYQSLTGLRFDLEASFKKMSNVLGSHDISRRFIIPDKLYGREKILNKLQKIIEATFGGLSQIVLIPASESGTGKTKIIHELYKNINIKNGYLMAVEFGQATQMIPYYSLINAFEDFVRQILKQPKQQISLWKNRIQKSLGANGQIMLEIVPSLIQLIGKQPPVSELGPAETQNRFKIVFESFFRTLASHELPLVIYLNNLQWADISSLKLLENLALNPQGAQTLIVIAYNANNIEEKTVAATLETIKKSSLPITVIKLGPLRQRDVRNLLAETLHASVEEVESLAQLCYEKSHGNPLLLKQFIKVLYQDGYIFYDPQKQQWSWDIDQIDLTQFPGSLIDFVTQEIRSCSDSTQHSLQIASCFKSGFDLHSLSVISEKNIRTIAKDMWEAMRIGLIVPVSRHGLYHYITEDKSYDLYFQFANEYVRSAAYSMIDPSILNTIHFKIGNILLENTSKKLMNQFALEIANHLNYGLDLMKSKKEKLIAAKLNLSAGIWSKKSISYKEALHFLKVGISCLPDQPWENHYSLTLALYIEAAEAAYLSGDFGDMDRYCGIVLEKAITILDKIKIYEIKILYLSDQNKLLDAVQIGITLLKNLGVKIPAKPTIMHLLVRLGYLQLLLRKKDPLDFLKLPLMSDQNLRAAMRILALITPAAYLTGTCLYQVITVQMLILSLKHGNTAESALGYATYGAILCILNKVKRGYQFGMLASQLVDKLNADQLKPRLYSILGFFILPRYEYLDKSILLMLAGIKISLETGENEFYGYLASGYAFHILLSGINLQLSFKELKGYFQLFKSLSLSSSGYYIGSCLQTIAKLTGSPADTQELNLLAGEWFNEEQDFPDLVTAKNNVGILNIFLCKLMLCYLLYDYKNAYKNAKNGIEYLKETPGLYVHPTFYFYNSLTCLELARELKNNKRNQLLKKSHACYKKIKKWAEFAPSNYQHKCFLIEAVTAEINKNFKKATKYFDLAIDWSKNNRFIHDEALANELAAKFYLSLNREKVAKVYMNEAYLCYKKWGATLKVKHLERKYQFLITNGGLTTKNIVGYSQFDFSELLKISEEVLRITNFEQLLKVTLELSVENSAAEKVMLLKKMDDEWYLKAEKINKNTEVEILNNSLTSDKLPLTIIEKVIATYSPILLEDASYHNYFVLDNYIQKNQPKSILCIPLINQGILTGILYLENNSMVGSLSQDTLDLFNLLSPQIAIAIDHAVLYEYRKKLNEAWDHFVPHEFLKILKKRSIIDVKLGDQVNQDMTIVFCKIENFAQISKKMNAQENMNFINDYASLMEPVIAKHHGLIDKYINDTIMALFATADDALQAAIEMLTVTQDNNLKRKQSSRKPISINIGINSGNLILGTVGGRKHIEGTVISDVVNVSSRVNNLSFKYKMPLLITEETYLRLTNGKNYTIRRIDTVLVKGKSIPITIFEVTTKGSDSQKVTL